MIRFIDLTDQITEGEEEFAFYDTVTDSFLRLEDEETWNSYADFKLTANLLTCHGDPLIAERCLALIPERFKNGHN